MKQLATRTVTRKKPTRKGGRPSAERSERMGDYIVEVASGFFLSQGYGATSIEAIAQAAGISKRTFYARFKDKEALFAAVVHQLVTRLRPEHDAQLFTGKDRETILLGLAKVILKAALKPEALALHRIMVGEAMRFPELAKVMDTQGARLEAVRRIADLLQHTSPNKMQRREAEFAAEQFLDSVVTVPQRRASGLGTPMTQGEIDRWGRQAVALFLNGCDGLKRA
jgi:TetR/AcrR family transcriptional repressor of mexJK operon